MAKGIGLVRNIAEKDRKERIIYYDASAVDKDFEIVNRLIRSGGNFRITTVALNELKAWKEPSKWNAIKYNKWRYLQELIAYIERHKADHIDEVSPSKLFQKLTELEHLLSKTITFNVLFEDIDKLIKGVRHFYLGPGKWKEVVREIIKIRGHNYPQICLRIHNKELEKANIPLGDAADREAIEANIKKQVYGIIKTIVDFIEGHSINEIVEKIKEKFNKETYNDKLIAEHYLLAKHPNKHLATDDKDIYEMISLLRRQPA